MSFDKFNKKIFIKKFNREVQLNFLFIKEIFKIKKQLIKKKKLKKLYILKELNKPVIYYI